jgi:hypothetical protein
VSLKVTSDPIAISFELTESGANTFTQEQISLQLDILNNEVAVVYAIDLDLESPDAPQQAKPEPLVLVTATV